jgi:hypothetical protein
MCDVQFFWGLPSGYDVLEAKTRFTRSVILDGITGFTRWIIAYIPLSRQEQSFLAGRAVGIDH